MVLHACDRPVVRNEGVLTDKSPSAGREHAITRAFVSHPFISDIGRSIRNTPEGQAERLFAVPPRSSRIRLAPTPPASMPPRPDGHAANGSAVRSSGSWTTPASVLERQDTINMRGMSSYNQYSNQKPAVRAKKARAKASQSFETALYRSFKASV